MNRSMTKSVELTSTLSPERKMVLGSSGLGIGGTGLGGTGLGSLPQIN